MKSRFLKQSVSMLMAAQTLISVLTISAGAEELLPEEYGGAVYDTAGAGVTAETGVAEGTCGTVETGVADEIMVAGTVFDEPASTDTGYGGAIYSDGSVLGGGDIVMPVVTFTSFANENTADAEEANGGTSIDPVQSDPVQGEACNASQRAAETQAGTEIPDRVETISDGDEFGGEEISEAPVTAENPEQVESVSDGDEFGGEEISEAPVTAENPEQAECVPDGDEFGVEEISEAPVTAENPEQVESVSDGDGIIPVEIPEAFAIAEFSVDSNADPAYVAAGIDVVGKVVPQPHPYDPNEEIITGKNAKRTRELGDAIIGIGELVIPFGPTISNFIRSRSPRANELDGAETAIELIADTAAYAAPVAAPLITIASDIALKIRKLFK